MASTNFAIVATSTIALYLLVQINSAYAAIYTVGDEKGWTREACTWPEGKTFKGGDMLIFKYSNLLHSVAILGNQTEFDNCILPVPHAVFSSGNDSVTLNPGDNFFACAAPGHCANGMKMKVTAT